MNKQLNKTPLQGITLEQIITNLFEKHGWEALGRRIKIRCFITNPSIKSSLTFLRKTPWARAKVERLYLAGQKRPRQPLPSKPQSPGPPASTWCKPENSPDENERK